MTIPWSKSVCQLATSTYWDKTTGLQSKVADTLQHSTRKWEGQRWWVETCSATPARGSWESAKEIPREEVRQEQCFSSPTIYNARDEGSVVRVGRLTTRVENWRAADSLKLDRAKTTGIHEEAIRLTRLSSQHTPDRRESNFGKIRRVGGSTTRPTGNNEYHACALRKMKKKTSGQAKKIQAQQYIKARKKAPASEIWVYSDGSKDAAGNAGAGWAIYKGARLISKGKTGCGPGCKISDAEAFGARCGARYAIYLASRYRASAINYALITKEW